MKIAFDLDATILTQGSPDKNYIDSKVKKGMVEFVNKFYEDGHEIYFYTARHFKHHLFTDKFLKDAGFKYHGLYLNKISVDLFVDDRAFRWEDGKESELEKLISFMSSIEKYD